SSPCFSISRDSIAPSEVQAGLASRLGQRTNAAMVKETVSIEDDLLDTLLETGLGDSGANLLGLLDLGARGVHVLHEGGAGDQGRALFVVDDLDVDVTRAAEDRKARPLGRARDLGADALLASKSILSVLHGKSYLPDLPAFCLTRSPV